MKKISIFWLFFLIIAINISFCVRDYSKYFGDMNTGGWKSNSFASYDNPAWRNSSIRRDVERRNVFNRPLEYQRYSEMGPYEEASPYAQYNYVVRPYSPYVHSVPYSYPDFNLRHPIYYRGVYFDGYMYRNMRW